MQIAGGQRGVLKVWVRSQDQDGFQMSLHSETPVGPPASRLLEKRIGLWVCRPPWLGKPGSSK